MYAATNEMPTTYLNQCRRTNCVADWTTEQLRNEIQAIKAGSSWQDVGMIAFSCITTTSYGQQLVIRTDPTTRKETLLCVPCYKGMDGWEPRENYTILHDLHLIGKVENLPIHCQECQEKLLKERWSTSCDDCIAEYIMHADLLHKCSRLMVSNRISLPQDEEEDWAGVVEESSGEKSRRIRENNPCFGPETQQPMTEPIEREPPLQPELQPTSTEPARRPSGRLYPRIPAQPWCLNCGYGNHEIAACPKEPIPIINMESPWVTSLEEKAERKRKRRQRNRRLIQGTRNPVSDPTIVMEIKICAYCGQRGHTKTECQIVCPYCLQMGHISDVCEVQQAFNNMVLQPHHEEINTGEADTLCEFCNQVGHSVGRCEVRPILEAASPTPKIRQPRRCSLCSKIGHRTNECTITPSRYTLT